MDGLLVVDKPTGPTSHDIVASVRRALRESRVGHTGTLDPLATGVLPLVIGRATRLARFLSGRDKEYEAVIALGQSTDTGDSQGAVVGAVHAGPLPDATAVAAALVNFRGTYLQRPPVYSAKKIDGERSYRLARRRSRNVPAPPALPALPALSEVEGSEVEGPAPVSVTAHAVELVGLDGASATVRIRCSAGFYVRALARDLGELLGTGAHLTRLTRTASGHLRLADAVPFARLMGADGVDVARQSLIAMADMLPWLPGVTLTPEGAERARHGRDLSPRDARSPFPVLNLPELSADAGVRLLDERGVLVGVGTPAAAGLLHPAVVLV